MDPDPLTSVVNALQYHPADEIIISTYPIYKSRWMRGDLINQVRKATGRRVEHVVAEPEPERDELPLTTATRGG
jgi:hypothetical protein